MEQPYQSAKALDGETYVTKPVDNTLMSNLSQASGGWNGMKMTRPTTGSDTKENGTPLFLQQMVPVNDKTNFINLIEHQRSDDQLPTLFFSSKNIQIIQNGIRAKIYEKTNKKYIIEEQDPDILRRVMNSYYNIYSVHSPYNIKEQIEILNNRVIDYSVKNVYNELLSYISYKKDVYSLAEPMDLPTSFSSKNSTLETSKFM